MIINIKNNKLINAFYGTQDKKINVINIILKNLDTKIRVNNKTFKQDPCKGKVKKLFLTLKNNSKFEFNENSLIIISENEIQLLKNTADIKNQQKNKTNPKTENKQIQANESNTIINKFNYILSTNVRDENNILEFLLYHIIIGFDRILVIDHLSKSQVSNKIKILPDEYREKIDVIRFKHEGSYKLHFLNDIVIPYMKKNCNKYFIHLDGDEYINLNNKHKNINSLMQSLKFPDILNLNWLLFGSNNKEHNDNINKCLIPTYTKSENNLNNHFKSMINVSLLDDNTYFINPHHIFNEEKKLVYTNVCNKKFNFNIREKCYNLFIESLPLISIKDAPAYINHYTVQSKEDYNLRKIKRNRDDIGENRELDENIFNLYNDVVNNNLQKYYENIENILTLDKVGFIILRYVIDKITNKMWIKCYDSIRKFYNNKIMIIDDHSKKEYISNKKLSNCFIINSEFKGAGELLPYYYFLKYKFCERIVVLHDSMSMMKKIDFENINKFNNFTRIFSFSNKCYNIDINYFNKFCSTIKNGDIVYKYHLDNKKKLLGCFGVCYVIDYKFLKYIDDKYDIKKLVTVINTREKERHWKDFFLVYLKVNITHLNYHI